MRTVAGVDPGLGSDVRAPDNAEEELDTWLRWG
jgi:hypothetical protein